MAKDKKPTSRYRSSAMSGSDDSDEVELTGFPQKEAGKGDVIHSSIWFPDKTYKPGDEQELADAGFESEQLQEWSDKGLISGFGTTAPESKEEKEEEEK